MTTSRSRKKYQTLTESLEELERTDPKVAEAKRKYNDMVDRWKFRRECGLDPIPGNNRGVDEATEGELPDAR